MGTHGRRGDYGRIQSRPYRGGSVDRQRRLFVTIGVGAAVLILLGTAIGFALGRATAPEPQAPVKRTQRTETAMPSGVVETFTAEASDSMESSEEFSAEETTTADETRPPRPKQLAPADGAVIDASRVYLRWSKSEDDSGEPVAYSFEIQDRLPDGSYGKTQVISGLESRSYSARVLSVKRRWRVWATDEAGNDSKKSSWRYYQHKPKPVAKPQPKPKPKATPEPSDETT